MNQINCDLLDVINGYSRLCDDSGKPFYYQHIKVRDIFVLDRVYSDRLKESQQRGIQSESEIIENAIKYGKWTKQDEEFITATQWEIDKLEKAAEKIQDKHQKLQAELNIKNKREAVQTKQKEREALCSCSAERLADFARLRYILEERCFKDEAQTEKLEEIPQAKDISDLFGRLNEEKHLLKLAFSPSFFDVFTLYRKDPYRIFDKSAFNLSVYQKNLLTIGGVLLAKIENYGDDMDEKRKNDPNYVYNFKPKGDGQKNKAVSDHKDLMHKARQGKKITPEDYLGV